MGGHVPGRAAPGCPFLRPCGAGHDARLALGAPGPGGGAEQGCAREGCGLGRLRAGRRDRDVGSGERRRCGRAVAGAARSRQRAGREAGGGGRRGRCGAGAGGGHRVWSGQVGGRQRLWVAKTSVRSEEPQWHGVRWQRPSAGCHPVPGCGPWPRGVAAHGHGPRRSRAPSWSVYLCSFGLSLQQRCLLGQGGDSGCAVGTHWPRPLCWLQRGAGGWGQCRGRPSCHCGPAEQ